MNYNQAVIVCKKDLLTYSKQDLQILSKYYHTEYKSKEHASNRISKLIMKDYYKTGNLERVKVYWGKYSDKLDYINAFADNLAKKFQEYANIVGIGGQAPRGFEAEPIIDYMLDNKITKNIKNTTFDDVIRRMIDDKIIDANIEEFVEIVNDNSTNISRDGHQCISECYERNGDRVCNVSPYSYFFRTYDWDYCDKN